MLFEMSYYFKVLIISMTVFLELVAYNSLSIIASSLGKETLAA